MRECQRLDQQYICGEPKQGIQEHRWKLLRKLYQDNRKQAYEKQLKVFGLEYQKLGG